MREMAGGLERPPAAWGGAGGGQRAPGQRRRPITRLAAHAPPPSSSAQSPHEVPGHEKQKTAAQHVVGVRPLGRQPRERRRVGRVELHAQGHWGGRVGRAALACGGAERDAGGRRRPQAAACALPPTPAAQAPTSPSICCAKTWTPALRCAPASPRTSTGCSRHPTRARRAAPWSSSPCATPGTGRTRYLASATAAR